MSERSKALITRYTKTKYCRIYATKRCESQYQFLKILSLVYNIALCALSIVACVYANVYVSIVASIMAVAVLAVTLFATNLDYKGQAKEHMSVVSKVSEIITKLNDADDSDCDKLELEYNSLMTHSLTHKDCDYCSYKHDYPHDFLPEEDSEKAMAKYEMEQKRADADYYKYIASDIILKTILTAFIYLFYLGARGILKAIKQSSDNKKEKGKAK